MKIHSLRLLPVFSTMLLLGAAIPAPAAPEPTPTPAVAPVAPVAQTRPFPFQRVVVSVDAAARTFRMGKKIIHQVHVLPTTRVMKGDGTPGVFEALAPGVEVRGSVRKRADGDYDAVSVKIGPKPLAGAGQDL